MPFGELTPRRVQWTWSIDTRCLVRSKATNGTTDSAVMDELRDMKNNFRG